MVYVLPPIPGAWWGIGRELSCSDRTILHTWGSILRTTSLHIPYKCPIFQQGDRVSVKLIKRHLTQRNRIYMQFVQMGTILTKYQPPWGGFRSKSPSFLQHLLLARWGIPSLWARPWFQDWHTIDRCMKEKFRQLHGLIDLHKAFLLSSSKLIALHDTWWCPCAGNVVTVQTSECL